MTKILIAYRSKYGATRRYAEMMAARTGADLRENNGLSAEDFAAYDTVLFFCAIYASGAAGMKTLKNFRSQLAGKRVAVFCVGASPYDENALAELKVRNGLADVPLFYGRGAWNEQQMHFADRTLCKLLQCSLTRQDPSTFAPWQKALLEAQGQVCDWVDAQYLVPLERWLAEAGTATAT